MNEDTLAHERLDTYQAALSFAELADGIHRRLPKAKGQLGDQLKRASESIVLRIAEGVGVEKGTAEQRRHWRAARGSALECSAVLDLCRIRKTVPVETLDEGRGLLLRLVRMLSGLARSS